MISQSSENRFWIPVSQNDGGNMFFRVVMFCGLFHISIFELFPQTCIFIAFGIILPLGRGINAISLMTLIFILNSTFNLRWKQSQKNMYCTFRDKIVWFGGMNSVPWITT